jgi:hypothetical protein
MSYISLILPAFHLNTIDKNEISIFCSKQFNISKENFDLLEFKDEKYNDKINYGIILNNSNLSLQNVEQLIYERNCIQNLSEKAFEMLKLISKKINDLEHLINCLKKENQNFEKKLYIKNFGKEEEEKNNNIITLDKEKGKPNIQIEYCEKTINKIKMEFKSMVKEINSLNKKGSTNDKYIEKDIVMDNYNVEGHEEIKKSNEENLFISKCI